MEGIQQMVFLKQKEVEKEKSYTFTLQLKSSRTSVCSKKTLYVNQLAQSLAHSKPWRNARSCGWCTGVFGHGAQERSLALARSESCGIVDEGQAAELKLKHGAEDWFKPVTVSSFGT